GIRVDGGDPDPVHHRPTLQLDPGARPDRRSVAHVDAAAAARSQGCPAGAWSGEVVVVMTAADRPVAPARSNDDPLDVVDRVARLVVSAAAPVRLAVARTDSEREASFRLRYRAVIEN